MTESLDGKAALVTGGTRGIGRAVVERLRSAGARVCFTGTDPARGAAAAAATGAHFLRFEAGDPDAAAPLVADAVAQLGGLDILVSNAGGLGEPQDVEATTLAAYQATLDVHLRAPWLLMQAAVPAMREAGGGSIVTMASVAGHRVGASSAAYSVAKAALIHLTRCAAAEFGPDRIRVNSISPGFVETSIHASALPDAEVRGPRFVEGLSRLFLNRQALPHVGQPDDIAGLVLFLASDASAFVTGTDIVADGGLSWGRHGLL